MDDNPAPPHYNQIAHGEKTNQAYQDDESISYQTQLNQNGLQNSDEDPVEKNTDLQMRRISYDAIKRTIIDSDVRKLAASAPTKSSDLDDSRLFRDETNKFRTTSDNARFPAIDSTKTVERNAKHLTLDMPKATAEGPSSSHDWSSNANNDLKLEQVRRKISAEDKLERYSRSSRGNSVGHSVSSPGCKSDISSIQSPYTESVCLQMLNESFDSSAFNTTGSGSELSFSVLPMVNEDAIAVDDTVTNTDPMFFDDVFNTTLESGLQKDGVMVEHSNILAHGNGSGSSKSESRFGSPTKYNEKFKKVPVVENSTEMSSHKNEETQIILDTDNVKGEKLSTATAKDDHNEKANAFANGETNINTANYPESCGGQIERGKASYHITHPREYDKLHTDQRTLVMQSDDVIHCQFLDKEYDAYKERMARLSVYSRDLTFMPPRSKDYLQLSCLVMFCCNPVFGIIAFSFSGKPFIVLFEKEDALNNLKNKYSNQVSAKISLLL